MWLHPCEYLIFTPFMRSFSLDNPFDANDHYEILASSLFALLKAVSMIKTPKIIVNVVTSGVFYLFQPSSSVCS